MTFSWQKNEIAFENEANSDKMTKEATILLFKVCGKLGWDMQQQKNRPAAAALP